MTFESRTRVKEVEGVLRRVLPEGSLIVGYFIIGKEEDGCDVYSYAVVLLLPLGGVDTEKALNVSGESEEMVEGVAFREFVREHVMDMEVEVCISENGGDRVLEMAELCKGLGWLVGGHWYSSREIQESFGDVWMVSGMLTMVGKLLEVTRGEEVWTKEENCIEGEEVDV